MAVGDMSRTERNVPFQRGSTLPELTVLHLEIDGWETILSFWVSADFQLLFSYGLVSGRVYAEKKTSAKHHTYLPR